MYFNSKTVIAVVIYEMPVGKCPTLQSLLATLSVFGGYTLYIYDNGRENQLHQIRELYIGGKIEVCYHHNPENPGVAAAYNHVGAFGIQAGCTHLILLDQDTYITEQYVAEIGWLLQQKELPALWVPSIYCNRLLISPIVFRLGRFWELKTSVIGKLNAKPYTVINSGMTITLDAFQHVLGYDEDFPLDLSDHMFLRRYKKKYASFYVMQTSLQHNLSVITNTSKKQALKRYQIQKKASLKFVKKTGNFLHFFWCLLMGARLCIRFKTLQFLIR